MGCEKTKCLLCKKVINSDNEFQLMMQKIQHLKEKHPEIYEQNRKAELEYQADIKKALDKKIKNSAEQCFSESKWDSEDYAD